jgi:hypothetical protein
MLLTRYFDAAVTGTKVDKQCPLVVLLQRCECERQSFNHHFLESTLAGMQRLKIM